MKTNFKSLALIGVFGGIICMLSNWILFMGSPDVMANPDPSWIEFSSIRYALSEILIVVGTAGCLGGFISMYMMVKDTCGKGMQRFAAVGAIGIVGTAMAHSNFGCVEPLIYKVLMQNDISTNVYLQIDEMISSHFGLADVVVVFASVTQAIIAIYLVLSGKAKKWMLLYNIIVTFAIGFVIKAILNNAVGNVLLCGAKSFGEAAMYLIPYRYWKNKLLLDLT